MYVCTSHHDKEAINNGTLCSTCENLFLLAMKAYILPWKLLLGRWIYWLGEFIPLRIFGADPIMEDMPLAVPSQALGNQRRKGTDFETYRILGFRI